MKARLVGIRKYEYVDKKTGELKTGSDIHVAYKPGQKKDGETVIGEIVAEYNANFNTDDLKIGALYVIDTASGISEDGRRWKSAKDAIEIKA